MKEAIISLVECLTLNRVRGQHKYGKPSLRWWWTPWTYRFRHSGWIHLSFSWFRRYWPHDQA